MEAKNAFPKIRMAQIESPELKKISAYCVGKISVLLHSSLYRVLKLMFPTDVGSIFTVKLQPISELEALDNISRS